MKYGFFSDVHANLEALDAVLELLKTKQVARYVCAGDLVGYGPNPNECIDIVRTLPGIRAVAGNHDYAVCGLKDTTWFNEYARMSVQWTRQVVSRENMNYLSALPKTVMTRDFMLVHGSPRDPIDEYLLGSQEISENMSLVSTPFCLVGHTHVPLFAGASIERVRGNATFLLSPGKKYILNPGAVGQPRDGDNRASCAVFDPNTGTFDFYRIAYDIEKTQRKMHEVKLPPYLIERLAMGK